MGVKGYSGQPMMVLFTQDRFDFQRNLHLFADHDAAALEDSVSAHAEIGPVDLGRRAEARMRNEPACRSRMRRPLPDQPVEMTKVWPHTDSARCAE
jgi:hypothetical protein